MIQLLSIEENIVSLNTNMTSETFAKTRFAEKLKEKGVLAQKENGIWKFDPWTFDSTAEEDEKIVLKGTAFKGKIAAEILTEENFDRAHKVSIAICNALESALKSKAPVTNIGAGGIIVSENLDKILFIPYNFWTTATMSSGDENYSECNGFYINQSQTRESAIRFTQAVLVYKTIAGFFPFAEKDTKKRSEDIIDENYSPLKWTIPGVDKKITAFTEKAFTSKTVEFPEEEFLAYKKTEVTEEELIKFRKEAEAAAAGKQKMVSSKRFVRAKRTGIIAVVIATAVITLVAVYLRKTSLEKPTSKGLSSLETLEMYYTAVNELNVDAAKNCTIGLSSHVDAISNIFLKSRTRSMYDRLADTVTPAAWLIKNQTRHNIYGLTNFLIDGKEGSLLVEGPRKNTKPKAVTEENGIQLNDGDTRAFNVEFITLDTTGEDLLAVYETKEKTILTYKKDRWVVSSIETELKANEFKMSEFANAYLECMKAESNEKQDVLAACNSLAEKYFFIPTEHEIDEGYEYLKKISVFNFD